MWQLGSGALLRASPGISGTAARFGGCKFPSFWWIFLNLFSMGFGFLFENMFDDFPFFSITFSSMTFGWCLMHLGKDWWSHFQVFLDEFLVRAQTLQILVFWWQYNGLTCLYTSEKTRLLMIFMNFSNICFGNDFRWVLASIVVPFWHPFGINFHVLWFLISK